MYLSVALHMHDENAARVKSVVVSAICSMILFPGITSGQ
jgi:hypothetical protein